ncbi:carboxymuconolactone decarboxylase family protein [Brevibacterium renqingii]|uniref:carboxymuconolactone decarboxylase family protein n=1 Tax=Brevibacterium renqingii TaxID=2776916 RepID=UPI00345AAB05
MIALSMNANRPFIDKTHPEVYKAMAQAAAASRKVAHAAGLTDGLIELVNTRVSQINGCRTCLSIHAPAARKAGIDQLKLDVLPSWHEAEIFDDRERAALTLAESLTVLDKTVDRDEIAAEAGQHLTTEQISAVEWTTTLINAFNRISIASDHPVFGAKQD